jgi:DNA adenine methylase
MSSSSRVIAFNYFGGKFNHVDWVIKHLPQTKTYIEVFGGSGVVLFNKKPSRIEAYNDINSTLYNFFYVLREHREELIEKIYFTPYSQHEYHECFINMNKGDEVERARRFFVVVNQSFNGTYSRQTGWKMSTVKSNATIAEAVNRWLTKLPHLFTISERLKQIEILKLDFRKVFEKFDGSDTLFYCDPPYMHSTRCNNNEYEFEMSTNDHKDFLGMCNRVKGKVAISGYDNELYNDCLKGFYKSIAKEKRDTLMHSKRREVLWMNYNPEHINEDLFTRTK